MPFKIKRSDLPQVNPEEEQPQPLFKIPKDQLKSVEYAPYNHKPIIKNEDGTFSTEETITIKVPDNQGGELFVNIPTIVNGQRVSPEDAERLYHQGTNQSTGAFPTLDQAVQAAQARSDLIGQSMQALQAPDPESEPKRPRLENLDIDDPFFQAILDPEMRHVITPESAKTMGGIVETGTTFATSFLAAIPGTIGGSIAAYFDQFRDNGQPGQAYMGVFEAVQKALTFQPRTEKGQKFTRAVGDALDFSKSAEGAGKEILDRTGSVAAATAIHTLIEGAPVWVPFALGRGASIYGSKKAAVESKAYTEKVDAISKEPIENPVETPEIRFTVLEERRKAPREEIPFEAEDRVWVWRDELDELGQLYRDMEMATVIDKGKNETIVKLDNDTWQTFKNTNIEKIETVREQLKHSTAETVINTQLAKIHKDLDRRSPPGGGKEPPAGEGIEGPGGKGGQQKRLGQGPREYNPENANKVKSAYDRIDQEKLDRENAVKRTLMNRIKTGLIDTQAGLKELLDKGGEVGRDAIRDVELVAGATPKAHLKATRALEVIYKGLNKTDIQSFDRMINALRTIQIFKNKGDGKVKRPTGNTINEHLDYLRSLKEELGKEKFVNLMDRAKEYFRTTNQILREYYAEGLIDKEAFNKMKNDIYEPSKFFDHIDPIPKPRFKGEKVNVRESGVAHLDAGSMKALELDSRALLSEYLVRAENRMFKNRALKSIARFAEVNPENGWVKYRKRTKTDVDPNTGEPLFSILKEEGVPGRTIIPEETILRETFGEHGPVTSTLEFFDNGIKQRLVMDKVIADQFVTRDPQLSSSLANILRVASGSFILRPLATGVNPEFAIKNLPRDVLHAYISSSVYSKHLPRFTMQIGRDMAVTMKDAFTKKGRFEDFINEGGGMSFLTNQGAELMAGKGANPLTHPGLRKFKEVITRINEATEIWVRLAIRERTLRNGIDPVTATWEGRRVLDFSQGGKYTKAADHAIPYLNASFQAFRTSLKGLTKKGGRKDFAVKASWLGGTSAMLWISNYLVNPEGWNQVSSKDRRENFIVMTPFWTMDDQNNKRYIYFKLKKDNSMIPFTYMWEAPLERTLEGRIPDNETLEVVRSSAPIVPIDALPPTMAAYFAYMQNIDFWTNSKVWKGNENVSPELRYNPETHPHPTPQFWIDLGKEMGLSPIQAERALKKIVPSNTFSDLAGAGFNELYKQLSPVEQRDATDLMLQNIPFLRKFASYTHPMSREMEHSKQFKTRSADAGLVLNRQVDTWYADYKDGQIGIKEVERNIKNVQPPEDRARAYHRFQAQHVLNRIFNRPRADGVPSKGWWLDLNANIDGRNRAVLYFETWKAQSPEARNQMDLISKQLKGFRDSKFQHQLKILYKQRGTERNN